MKTTIRTRRIIGGLIAAGSIVGAAGRSAQAAPAASEPPKIVSETTYYKDVSAYFYKVVPFLKPGLQFLDSSTALENNEGKTSSLLVGRADNKSANAVGEAKAIHTTKDFAPFVDKIKTAREALTYAMFVSRKGFPWMEPIRFDYFQDVPFISLEFVHVSSATLAAHAIRPPRATEEKGSLMGKKRFVIVRTVVPLDQPSLKEEKILAGKSPLELSEVAEVTETVAQDGTYSFSLRRIPVQKFPIENPLRTLRKTK